MIDALGHIFFSGLLTRYSLYHWRHVLRPSYMSDMINTLWCIGEVQANVMVKSRLAADHQDKNSLCDVSANVMFTVIYLMTTVTVA